MINIKGMYDKERRVVSVIVEVKLCVTSELLLSLNTYICVKIFIHHGSNYYYNM